MSGYVPFSKRDKPLPDTYTYNEIPDKLRIQVIHIWNDIWESYYTHIGSQTIYLYDEVEKHIKKEHGLVTLTKRGTHGPDACCEFMQIAPTDQCLDMIEYSFYLAEVIAFQKQNYDRVPSNEIDTVENGIKELNHRFRESGIGYQYENYKLIRIDSQHVHQEVTRPALALLQGQGFAGPNKEFMEAHEHYRHGRHEDAVATCRKAFESTLKSICDARGWSYAPTATAAPLVQIMFDNGLVPLALQSYFDNLRAMMQSCVPTLANKNAAHGSGPVVRVIGEELAAYVLHQTASNIVFLVQSHQAKP